MTPNRKLSTSAIAVLVAVSTVFTGVTPAVASDNPGSQYAKVGAPGVKLGFSDKNGTANHEGKVRSDDSLLEATNSIKKKIDDYELQQTVKRLGKVFVDYNPNKELSSKKLYEALNATEEEAYEALLAQYKEVTATLEEASQNMYDATTSLKDALAKDRGSKSAFQKSVDYLNSLSKKDREALNTLINDVNVNDRQKTKKRAADGTFTLVSPKGPFTGPGLSGLNPIPSVPEKINSEQTDNLLAAIMKHRTMFRELTADQSDKQFVNRYYARALKKLLDSPLVKGLIDPYEASQDALAASQLTDIIALQVLQTRARAQVEALRAIQAQLFMAVRILEISHNDTTGNNGAQGLESVQRMYLRALGEGSGSLSKYLVYVAKKRTEANMYLEKHYPAMFADTADGDGSDRKNGYVDKDAEYNAWNTLRSSFGMKTLDDIARYNGVTDAEGADSFAWYPVYMEARMKDALYFANDREAKQKTADMINAYKKAQEDLEVTTRDAKKKADKIVKLEEENKDLKAKLDSGRSNPGKDPEKEAPGQNHDGDNSFPIVPVAIIGVVLAALAAFAGNIPVIAAMLPKI